jgi:hypothetical protein
VQLCSLRAIPYDLQQLLQYKICMKLYKNVKLKMFWLVDVSKLCTVNIKMTNLNPTPPTIRGLIKSHIISAPIGPIVNWANGPQCKFATIIANSLESYLLLPHVFNVKSMTH